MSPNALIFSGRVCGGRSAWAARFEFSKSDVNAQGDAFPRRAAARRELSARCLQTSWDAVAALATVQLQLARDVSRHSPP
uniref:Uncharacterized protein n=1 Tax=Paraburkholderia sprentiae WSM5005 TaxID=754502 RepID=A0A1I9YFA1_9BURK